VVWSRSCGRDEFGQLLWSVSEAGALGCLEPADPPLRGEHLEASFLDVQLVCSDVAGRTLEFIL
jgi:hypothetical protein